MTFLSDTSVVNHNKPVIGWNPIPPFPPLSFCVFVCECYIPQPQHLNVLFPQAGSSCLSNQG